MLILIGKSASGKDTIKRKLIKEFEFKPIVSYTTRPIRVGEKEGEDYYYINELEFQKKKEEGFFAEWKSYNTIQGEWYYGTAKEDIEKANDYTVMISTPRGVRDILKEGYEPKVAYINADIETISKRLYFRGDNRSEIQRRMLSDSMDFKNVEDIVDFNIKNNINFDINDVIHNLLVLYRKEIDKND